MQLRDFSILFQKIPTTGQKTDIAMVTGYNAIVQKISHLLNTNKGELTSDKNFGSNYYVFLFDPVGNKQTLEITLANYIEASIPGISNVTVQLDSYTETNLFFQIKFSYYDGIVFQNNIYCSVEVKI
jgi:phage baseplate assembly protein W